MSYFVYYWRSYLFNYSSGMMEFETLEDATWYINRQQADWEGYRLIHGEEIT